MYRKLATITPLLIVVLALLAVSVASPQQAEAARAKAKRYRIVHHGRTYDKVRRHHKVLRVRRHERYVLVRGVPRFRVVGHTRSCVYLKRAADAVVSESVNTGSATGAIVSVGVPSSASSTRLGTSPSAANDGDATTCWVADSRSFPQWWTVDLGAVTDVGAVKTDWYDAAKRSYRYRVEASADGVTFVTLVDRSSNVVKGATTDALDVSARYLRVQVLGVNGKGSAAITEFTVYDDSAQAPPSPTPTPTPSATATASPTATPTPTPSATVSSSATPTPTPTPTAPAATPTPTPTPSVTGATCYVSTAGSDTTGDGSSGKPWRTIQKAANSISAGKTVSVAAGTYNERVTIPSAKSGTASAPTKFVASGRVIVAQGFEIDAAYTVLDGFEITPGSSSITDADYRGQVWVRNANVSLLHLDLHDLTSAAAICLGSSAPVANRTLIEDCIIARVPWNAISVDNGGSGSHPADVVVRRATISDYQGVEGIKAYGDRWLIEDSSVQGPARTEMIRTNVDGDGIRVNYAGGTVIRRTRIFDVWQHTPYTASGYHTDGIQLWDSVRDLLLDGVTIGSWRPGGVDNAPGSMNAIMAGTCNSNCSLTVQNSVLMSGIATGIQANAHLGCAAAQSGATVTIKLYNNTFVGNYPAWNGGNAVVSAYNNVFYSHRGGYYADASQSDANAFLWNQWTDYGVSGGSPQASSVSSTEGSNSLGRTSAARLSAADLFVNPDVSSATNYGLSADFRPKPGSVLIGAADPAYAPDHDITGAPRSATAPTIGAYE